MLASALRGNSFLLIGNAGVGKSYTLGILIDSLRHSCKHVIVTASTGKACTPLRSQGAQTLHSAFGIRDGRYSDAELKDLYTNDASFEDKRKRISQADTLVIDEISMISSKILHKVDMICRFVLSDKPMSGPLVYV